VIAAFRPPSSNARACKCYPAQMIALPTLLDFSAYFAFIREPKLIRSEYSALRRRPIRRQRKRRRDLWCGRGRKDLLQRAGYLESAGEAGAP
jgi:hypothetical protein